MRFWVWREQATAYLAATSALDNTFSGKGRTQETVDPLDALRGGHRPLHRAAQGQHAAARHVHRTPLIQFSISGEKPCLMVFSQTTLGLQKFNRYPGPPAFVPPPLRRYPPKG